MRKIPQSYRKHLAKHFTDEVLDYPYIVMCKFVSRPFAAKKFIVLEFELDGSVVEQKLKSLAHELVHVRQQMNRFIIWWFISYGMKFLKNYFLAAMFSDGFDRIRAYKSIPEEIEAYALEELVTLA